MKIRLLRLFEHMGVSNIEIRCVESLRSNADLTVGVLKNSHRDHILYLMTLMNLFIIYQLILF